MVEILRNPLALCITSNSFRVQQYRVCSQSNICFHCFLCNINFSLSSRKLKQRHARVCRLNVYGSLSKTQITVVRSKKKRVNAFVAASFESESGFKKEDYISKQEREEESSTISYEQQLPTWRNLEFQDDSDVNTSVEVVGGLLKPRLYFLEESDEEVLSKRILGLSRSNKVRSALDLYMSMEVLGLRPSLHACNSFLSCLLRNHLLDEALRIFGMMEEKEMTSGHTYSLILKAVASTQGSDSALKMFTELEAKVASKKNFDAIVYNTMISICAKANNWVQAERMWRIMKENHQSGTTITYNLLVSTFVRCDQNELALDAYHEMIENELKPNEDIMLAVIPACTKDGKWSLALRTFQNMLESGFNPSSTACNALINSLGKAGEVKLAFKVFGLMKSLGHAPDTYTWNALLGALYRGNRYADVLGLFESIKREQNSQLNTYLYNKALMSCHRLALWDQSLQLLWQMEAGGLPVPTASYNFVIGACEVARKPKVALQVYKHMVHQKCSPDIFTYLSLIRACIWGSLWVEVEAILEHVAPDVSLYNTVIQGMCLRGKTTSAKKLYMKMHERGLKPDGGVVRFSLVLD
ncbi:hypothetical protein NE237_006715 [Protea cynaroides]|uniref:Pentatricopeptide repeat-containing protein n=1 Tax=Protea cynaroides TaxID=273540 RepID=A0A9Q0KN16_9MAGN|nr:hypothetical protein NE237_006715 [Protea cynaroides]